MQTDPGWESDLANCFDRLERLFAAHEMDERRAFMLLARLRAEDVPWRVLRDQIHDMLESDGCSAQHIEMQMRQVEERFRPWLLG